MAQNINPKDTLGTQSLLPISEIRNNVVILKNSSLRSIIEVKGINLLLMSSEDQEAIIYSWQSFLNNLEFSLQVVALSRKENIDGYIRTINESAKQETNELLKLQINDYLTFIENFVKNYAILQKRFLVVVPYDPIVLKPTTFFSKLKDSIFNTLNFKRESFSMETVLPETEFQRNYQQLLIRQDTVLTHLKRIGMTASVLNTNDLIQLFYSLYNPGDVSTIINI